MDAEIVGRPAFAHLRVQMRQGDVIVAETDAMASMSSTISMKPKMTGGFFTALLRSVFGRESFFVNHFSAGGDGELVLTQPTPGDVTCLHLQDSTLYLQPGAFIAAEPGVRLGVGWAGFASFIGREGLFRLKATGTGRIWFGAYGGIFHRDIRDEWIVDTGHLVAYEPTVHLSVAMPAGFFSSFVGGEGLVTRLRGQGRVYLQSRSLSGLAAWTNTYLY
jgi:uncharacterized protein (TIGR00266 family)